DAYSRGLRVAIEVRHNARLDPEDRCTVLSSMLNASAPRDTMKSIMGAQWSPSDGESPTINAWLGFIAYRKYMIQGGSPGRKAGRRFFGTMRRRSLPLICVWFRPDL